jgi:DNA polymerase-1
MSTQPTTCPPPWLLSPAPAQPVPPSPPPAELFGRAAPVPFLKPPADLKPSTPAEVLTLIQQAGVLALDTETTGLDPRTDRIRLLTLSDGKRIVILDCIEYASAVTALLDALRGKMLVAHNAAFDLGFLWSAGLTSPPETVCTMLIEQLLTAGEGGHGLPGCSLASSCWRRLGGLKLAKELQTSDWSGPLSAEQLAYAWRDVAVLLPLFQTQHRELVRTGLVRTSDIELRALPAFVWMSQTGVPFNREAWITLAERAAAEKGRLEKELDQAAPAKGGEGLFGKLDCWDWESPKQIGEVLGQLGFDVTTTADAQLAVIDHPVTRLLRQHRAQNQLVKMYGLNWVEKAAISGERVFPSWKQIGTASGRTSCQSPNMQQVPRSGGYRACVAAPPGRMLVKADYSTLQMRIAAKWAKDDVLLRIFQANEDPHAETAKLLLGKSSPSKTDRQIAKSANFGLLFGMSPEGLRTYAKTTWGVDMTPEQAETYHRRWFNGYPGLKRWHEETKRQHVHETRAASGRRRLLPPSAPDTWRLNSPVQGDEADGLKLALALLWERRAECPGAFPILAVHDEITVECPEEGVDQVSHWLREVMVEGMTPFLEPVPVAVDVKIQKTWS